MRYAALRQITFLEVGKEAVPVFVDKFRVFLEFTLNHKFLENVCQ